MIRYPYRSHQLSFSFLAKPQQSFIRQNNVSFLFGLVELTAFCTQLDLYSYTGRQTPNPLWFERGRSSTHSSGNNGRPHTLGTVTSSDQFYAMLADDEIGLSGRLRSRHLTSLPL